MIFIENIKYTDAWTALIAELFHQESQNPKNVPKITKQADLYQKTLLKAQPKPIFMTFSLSKHFH